MTLERNTVADRILHAIDHGKLPPAQTETRLHALIDQEIDRTDMPADAALIDGCLELLEQLHAPVEVPDAPKRSARGFVRVCKWAAVAAAVIFLALGVTDNLRWQWYYHSTSEDGEQHIITGHEVEVDVIQKALAENQGREQLFKFASVEEMERSLGFNPGIPACLADTYEADSIDVSFLSEQITFLVAYRSDATPDSSVSLNVGCYVNLNDVSVAAETAEVGEICLIGGCSVYVSRGIDHEVAQWMYGNTCFVLRTSKSAVSVTDYAREIIGGVASDSGTGITAEQISASIQKNMSHQAEKLQTDDFGELCDYLGFVPDVIRPEAIGADSVIFTGSTVRAFLQVDVCYRDADGKTMTLFDSTYYSSMEETWYTFEESEAGEFIRIGNHSVYSTKNLSWRVYSWTEGMRFCSIATRMEHEEAVAMLEDYFAGNVIVRAEEPPMTGVTAEEITASIQRNMSHTAEQLETNDFGELCDYLGFVPGDIIRPEAIGADSVLFVGTTLPDRLLVDVCYRDADGKTIALFTCIYYSSLEEAWYAFEESEAGEYIRIGDRSVYSTRNYDWRVYSWTEGLHCCCFSTRMAHDDTVAVLEDYFAGTVIVRAEEPLLTGVTAEEIKASIPKSADQEMQYLRTSDYAKVCEFLGFAPELIRPEMLDAVRIDFYAVFRPDSTQLDAYYCNAEGYSKHHFAIYSYTEPDKIPYHVEENENGHFIDICGQQVYTVRQSATKAYSWRFDKGVCALYCGDESDLALPALEAYLSGDVLTSEAAAQLPTDATPQQIAAVIDEQDTRQISTGDFNELCDFLGFTPAIFRPEVFNSQETLYSATSMTGWTTIGALYQPEKREDNVVMHISCFDSVDEVYSNFEQSENGVFLNIAGTTVYCTPNLHRTTYAWVDGTVTYLLSGVLPQETTVPLLEAYLRGDRHTPDAPGTWPGQP